MRPRPTAIRTSATITTRTPAKQSNPGSSTAPSSAQNRGHVARHALPSVSFLPSTPWPMASVRTPVKTAYVRIVKTNATPARAAKLAPMFSNCDAVGVCPEAMVTCVSTLRSMR